MPALAVLVIVVLAATVLPAIVIGYAAEQVGAWRARRALRAAEHAELEQMLREWLETREPPPRWDDMPWAARR